MSQDPPSSPSENSPEVIFAQDFVERSETAIQKIRDVVRGNLFHPVIDVELIGYEEQILKFEAETRFSLHKEGGEKLAGATVGSTLKKFGGKDEMNSALEKDAAELVKDKEVLNALKKAVTTRDGKGMFWDKQRTRLALDPLEYYREEPCQHCRGQGHIQCPDCNGKGVLFTKGQANKPCARCKGTGKIECPKCRGRGTLNYVSSYQLYADSAFHLDKAQLPTTIAPIIERLGDKLITRHHARIVKIKDDIKKAKPDHKDAILTLCYEVELPIGHAVFRVGEEMVTALVFGYRVALLDVPPFLERYMLPCLTTLREAAKGQGNVEEKMRVATYHSRLSEEVVFMSAKIGPKKTISQLKNMYSIALEPEFIVSLVKAARGATNRLSFRPQLYGLMIGLMPAFLLMMLYVFSIQDMMISLPDILRVIIDILFILGCCLLPYFFAQLMTRQSMIYALGEQSKNVLRLPKLGARGLFGPAFVCLLFILFSAITYRAEGAEVTPQIYALVRGLFG